MVNFWPYSSNGRVGEEVADNWRPFFMLKYFMSVIVVPLSNSDLINFSSQLLG